MAAKYIPEDIAAKNSILPFFEFYYNEFIPVLSASDDPVKMSGSHAQRYALAMADIERLLDTYELGPSDVIFFPSIDFYSLAGLEACKDRFRQENSPRVLLRFIGVMENSSTAYKKPLNVALMYVRSLIDAGCKVSVSAETPIYADWLAGQLDTYVRVTPYGEVRDPIPIHAGKEFHVICPGSARFDKGFLRLENIFKLVRIEDPDISIVFSTQILVDQQIASYQTYLSRLYACPGVQLLPSALENEEMDELYKKCDLVLLPYDPEIYKYRGSAVLMEAATVGRPVIATEDVGFVEQIRYYGLGIACADDASMAKQIVEYSAIPKDSRWKKSVQARNRFVDDMRGAFRDWIVA
ncbi:glycosyltransferase [Methylobacterium mesophilicum]|uniref:glycosyltransferase n=1 Tax=Methylobacterium mesophilicum TaxID=39956 RepID=UPI002F350D89